MLGLIGDNILKTENRTNGLEDPEDDLFRLQILDVLT